MAKSAELPPQYSDDFIERMDGRTRIAQVVRSRYDALTSDLGGHDALSYTRRSLAKRAIYVEAAIEQQEAALSRGEPVDLGKVSVLTNSLIGLYKVLGLDRVAREVSLSDYIAAKAKDGSR